MPLQWNSREEVAKRFEWADILLLTGRQRLSDTGVRRSLLCSTQGSDSDFTGGAAAWECASQFLQVAGAKQGFHVHLEAKTICETWIC